GGEEVLVDAGHVEPELVHGGQHARVRQCGDGGVVQQDDVGTGALLGGEQRLVGQVRGVGGRAFDRHSRLLAAGVDPLGPGGVLVVLGVGVPPGVGVGIAAVAAGRAGGGEGERGGRQARRGGSGEGSVVPHCLFLLERGPGGRFVRR